jgi:hypothetical protein
VTTFILGGSVLEGVISENVTVELLMKYEEVKKKGKTHMKYVSGKTKIQPGSVFSDLRISSTVTNVMQIVINMVNKFFAKVLIEEAFD